MVFQVLGLGLSRLLQPFYPACTGAEGVVWCRDPGGRSRAALFRGLRHFRDGQCDLLYIAAGRRLPPVEPHR